MNFNYQLLI